MKDSPHALLTAEDIRRLAEQPEFIKFLHWMDTSRERFFADMLGAEERQIMQLSGRIIAYDEILQVCGGYELLGRSRGKDRI